MKKFIIGAFLVFISMGSIAQKRHTVQVPKDAFSAWRVFFRHTLIQIKFRISLPLPPPTPHRNNRSGTILKNGNYPQ